MNDFNLSNGAPRVPIPDKLPVLPLRDMVVFPFMVIPLIVGRQKTQAAVNRALDNDSLIALVSQKDSSADEPSPGEMHRIGVVARIVQTIKLPNGLTKVVVEGLIRIHVLRFTTVKVENYLQATIRILEDTFEPSPEIEAARRQVTNRFKEYVNLNKQIPDEVGMIVQQIESPRRLADFIIMHISRTPHDKQKYLETNDIYKLLLTLVAELNREIEILNIEQNIEGKVKEKMSKSQRSYYLQEQLRAIKKELGDEADDEMSDVLEYSKKIKNAHMSPEALAKAEEEVERLENTPMMSPEATVIRSYLDWLIDLPWEKASVDNHDIDLAQKRLDEDHFGLSKPKERILEQLAVLSLAKKIRGPILCLVGPPGVGKTSLGKSVARALSRQFVRVSLGGIQDESEIRGHRRTYVGAMPGRIIQYMKKAGTINPVFLLDEIDKLNNDYRGDPASALLEVLDLEQNHAFSDHYLEVEYDLSKVLFITTANYRDNIPLPLQDRMEVIELPGYLHQEKFEIAKRFLIPKQLSENGIPEDAIRFTDEAIHRIIVHYTREAGVRELERQIGKLVRKSAKLLVSKKNVIELVTVNPERCREMLGVAPYDEHSVDGLDRIGSAVGLAWTPVGGDLLMIEAETMKGKGTLTLTGHLGEVMQESARTALTVVRSRADKIGFSGDDFLKLEMHVHLPEGAVPKDGPSAGITMATAMASILSKRPVRGDVAMTGEITLRGDVLPIGGLREKLMAALRGGVTKVIIPEKNQRELEEIPEDVTKPLEIIPVKTIDEVFAVMLKPKAK